MRWRVCLAGALAVVALCTLLVGGEQAGAEEPDAWQWDLRIPLAPEKESWPVNVRTSGNQAVCRFTLVSGSRQGKSAWYVGDMTVHVIVSKESRAGDAYVEIASNGATFARLKFSVERTEIGAECVSWSMYGLVDGYRVQAPRTADVYCRVRNYLQDDGVRSGVNSITARVERDPGVEFGKVELMGSSAIRRTPVKPYPLSIGVGPSDASAVVGGVIAVRYVLSATGPQRVRDIRLSAVYEETELEMIGDPCRRYDALEGTVSGTLRFRVLALGRHEVALGGNEFIQ